MELRKMNPLEAPHVEAAIDVEDLPCGVVQEAIGNRTDRLGHIAPLAHAALREQSACDLLLVDLLHLGDHVRPNHTRTNLEDLHARTGQPLRVQRYRHTQARLRDAIFSAIHGGGVGGDRSYENDAAVPLLRHPPRSRLGEKMRAFEICSNQFIEALFGRFEQVAASARRHPCIIHQEVEAFEAFAREGHQLLAVRARGQVAGKNVAAGLFPQTLGRIQPSAISTDHPVRFGEFDRDRPADASAGPGHNACAAGGGLCHMVTGVSSTNVRRVSEGTFTCCPLVIASTPAPAAPPAAAPPTAPLPPPSMPPNTAPATAAPPATFAVFSPREPLSFEMVCVFTSTIRSSTFTDTSIRVSSAFPVNLPDSLASTSFTTTSEPRTITVSPLGAVTPVSIAALNVCPTRAVSESTPSIIRMTMFVPAGNSIGVRAGSGAGAGRAEAPVLGLSGFMITGPPALSGRRRIGRSGSESELLEPPPLSARRRVGRSSELLSDPGAL